MSTQLSIRDALAGKHILLIGGSGFLGKVWLSMLLHECPDVGTVTVLLRKKGLRGARRRLEKMVNESYAFQPWHLRHGDELGTFLAGKLEAVDGDLSEEGLGLDEDTAQRLKNHVDLVVNSAGLVDFDPDPRDALESNVAGPLHLLEFVRDCAKAKLLHVSTCYVAGNRQGDIPETVLADTDPNGNALDAATEYAEARTLFEQMAADFDTPATHQEVAELVQAKIERDKLDDTNEALVRNLTQKTYKKKLNKILMAAGTERARALGFPNTYTWSKFLSEALLTQQAGNVEITLVRPSIVESAFSYPMPGWVEGFKTSGPLIYLLGTWFRQLPARTNLPFDVIPVDMVSKSMFIAGEALLRGAHKPVYQAATSQRNRLTIGRSCELTALGHRKHMRKEGKSALERLVLSRWDSQIEDTEPLLSVPNIRKATKGLRGLLKNVPKGLPAGLSSYAKKGVKLTEMADRQLRGVERLMELFKPFTTDNWQVYEAANVSEFPVEDAFVVAPEEIDWLPYWTDVHMPGLRRWSFPELEGKSIERFRPSVKVRLDQAPAVSTRKEGAA